MGAAMLSKRNKNKGFHTGLVVVIEKAVISSCESRNLNKRSKTK
jgi:hypothetical protein